MTNNDELAMKMKAAAVRAKTATEEYASGHMSASVCYAECEEFNRLSDGPDNILALLAERDADKKRIAQLTSERDALREGEMGDAKHSNTRAAADIYFQLVEECNVPAGGSLVEHIDSMREHMAELTEANKRNAETDEALCKLLPGVQYMDPPDGGSVTPLEQVTRMVADYRNRIAELDIETAVKDASILELKQQYQRLLEARTVSLKPPALPILGSTAEWYRGFYEGAAGMRKECIAAITRDCAAAGINLEVGG